MINVKYKTIKIASYFFPKLIKQIRNFYTLAIKYGQWNSIRKSESVDEAENPLPWYTYPSIEYLSNLDLSRFSVCEYGSGNSTLWWSKRARSVESIEDSIEWYEKILPKLQEAKTKYHLRADQLEYVSFPQNKIDIIIIDGNHRKECAEHIVGNLDALMIILDNSDWYPSTVEYLSRNLSWLRIDFNGFGPINNYTWTTTIYINPLRFMELKNLNRIESKCSIQKVAPDDH